MAKQIALLEYTFMFDPTNTWQHGTQFEKDLGDFFAAHGFEANLVETRGNSNRRIFYIERIQAMPKLSNKTPQGPKSPQERLNQMRGHVPTKQEQRFKQGRFLKTKGYLIRK